MDETEPPSTRLEAVLVLVVYVLPLTLTIGVLALVGLPGLALALLAVEAFVASAVILAKRPDGAPRRPGPLVAGLLVLGLAASAGATVLLTPLP